MRIHRWGRVMEALLAAAIIGGCGMLSPKTGGIRGMVKDGETLIPNVTVVFRGEDIDAEEDDIELLTGEDGRFVFKRIDPGRYFLTIDVEFAGGRQCVIIASTQVDAGKQSVVDFLIPYEVSLSESGLGLDDNGNMIKCQP